MWTVEQRQTHDRSGLRYPSELTDAEWALVEPFIPPARRGGRRRTVDVREVLNGIFYILATGCQWRALPKDLPPRSTVHDYPTLWARDGTLRRLHHALFVRAGGQGGEPDGGDRRQPEREGRGKRGARVDPSGCDAGKKVEGKERHVPVGTLGLLLSAAIHPADVQDRDGAIPLLRAARRLFPFVEVIFADGACQGGAPAAAVAGTGRWRLEIVSHGDAAGFVPLAKRWIVERTFAWLGGCRPLGAGLGKTPPP